MWKLFLFVPFSSGLKFSNISLLLTVNLTPEVVPGVKMREKQIQLRAFLSGETTLISQNVTAVS